MLVLVTNHDDTAGTLDDTQPHAEYQEYTLACMHESPNSTDIRFHFSFPN